MPLSQSVRAYLSRARVRLTCWLLGHRWKYLHWTPDGGKIFECRRCGRRWGTNG